MQCPPCTLWSPSQVPAKILTKQIICCSCQARGGLVTDRAGCKDDNCLTFWLHLVSTSSAPAQPPVTAFIQVGNFKLLLNCNLDPLAGVGASIVPGPASAAICLLSCRCRGPWGRGEQICENCSGGGHQVTIQQYTTKFSQSRRRPLKGPY